MRVASDSQFKLASPSLRRSITCVMCCLLIAAQVSAPGTPRSTKMPGRTSLAPGMAESWAWSTRAGSRRNIARDMETSAKAPGSPGWFAETTNGAESQEPRPQRAGLHTLQCRQIGQLCNQESNSPGERCLGAELGQVGIERLHQVAHEPSPQMGDEDALGAHLHGAFGHLLL